VHCGYFAIYFTGIALRKTAQMCACCKLKNEHGYVQQSVEVGVSYEDAGLSYDAAVRSN